jgi:arylsulfatase A-like enzyme
MSGLTTISGPLFRTGHRIPFIVRWPGVTEAGTINTSMIGQVDLMATFAEIMGVTLPGSAGEDSFSLLSLFQEQDQAVRESMVTGSHAGTLSLRVGEWKYIAGRGAGPLGGKWDPKRHPGPEELYNLADDISETNNLAEQEPERLARMRAALEEIKARGRSGPMGW